MSWASKSTNDWLTKLDIAEGISAGALTAIGSGPSGKSNSDWVTRAEVLAWVQMGSSYYSSSDWATKGGVTSNALNLPYSFTVYYFSPHSNYQCWATKADACAHSPAASITIYSASSSITAGAVLYAYDGTNFYPRTWSTNGNTSYWLYDGTGSKPFKMVSAGSVTTSTVDTTDTCSTPYYYYDGEYWADCSGVTSYGEVIRSTVPLTLEWTRWDPASGGSGANYLRITGVSSSTAYTYISDDTQNSYCGY